MNNILNDEIEMVKNAFLKEIHEQINNISPESASEDGLTLIISKEESQYTKYKLSAKDILLSIVKIAKLIPKTSSLIMFYSGIVEALYALGSIFKVNQTIDGLDAKILEQIIQTQSNNETIRVKDICLKLNVSIKEVSERCEKMWKWKLLKEKNGTYFLKDIIIKIRKQ